MPVAVKPKRIRVTRKDIEAAKRELLRQPKPIRPKVEQEAPRYKKDFWYGAVYCDSYGYASIIGNDLQGIWLGKIDEFIPYLKSKRISKEDANDFDKVLNAFQEFRSEKKSQSYHLAIKGRANHNSIPPCKTNRITFKNDPQFLRLLEHLISKGYGIPTIQKELKSKGYDVAYATLGRWVHRRKDKLNNNTGGQKHNA